MDIKKDQKFLKISRYLMADGIPLPTDLFIRLPSGHHILVAKKGSKNLNGLSVVKDKKASLFTKEEEYAEALQFGLSLIDKTIRVPGVRPQFKLTLLMGVTESAFMDLSNNGAIEDTVDRCKEVVGHVQHIAKEIPDFNKLIEILSELPQAVVTSSIATAVVALAIAEEMGITQAKPLENLVLGAILHDIGLHQHADTFLKTPRANWKPNEQEIFANHPQAAANILRELREIPTDVISIALEHHELANGEGFPKKYRDIKLNPMGKIVAIADQFIDLLYDFDKTGKRRSAAEVISYIENEMDQPFNKTCFAALKKLNQKMKLKVG